MGKAFANRLGAPYLCGLDVRGEGPTMGTALARIQRLRALLEEGLTADEARAAIFNALSQWGPQIPSSNEELTSFVRGPLRRVLGTTVAAAHMGPLMLDIENSLAVIDSVDDQSPSPRPSVRPSLPASAESTWAMRPVSNTPLRVLVLSARSSLPEMLEFTVGPEIVTTTAISSIDGIDRELSDVEIVFIDGVDPLTVEPTSLASMLQGITQDVWLTIWGAERPFGREVAQALDAGGVHCVPLVTTEGIAPFIDLIRSRRG